MDFLYDFLQMSDPTMNTICWIAHVITMERSENW